MTSYDLLAADRLPVPPGGPNVGSAWAEEDRPPAPQPFFGYRMGLFVFDPFNIAIIGGLRGLQHLAHQPRTPLELGAPRAAPNNCFGRMRPAWE